MDPTVSWAVSWPDVVLRILRFEGLQSLKLGRLWLVHVEIRGIDISVDASWARDLIKAEPHFREEGFKFILILLRLLSVSKVKLSLGGRAPHAWRAPTGHDHDARSRACDRAICPSM